jgi:hypothetical protein
MRWKRKHARGKMCWNELVQWLRTNCLIVAGLFRLWLIRILWGRKEVHGHWLRLALGCRRHRSSGLGCLGWRRIGGIGISLSVGYVAILK